jgi:hypothetical protein
MWEMIAQFCSENITEKQTLWSNILSFCQLQVSIAEKQFEPSMENHGRKF